LNPATGSMVMLLIPATLPAKVTRPATGARTVSPTSALKSTPQWPAYWPMGKKGAVTGPETGGLRHTAAMAKTANISTSHCERNACP
jgi:hypothetical protein